MKLKNNTTIFLFLIVTIIFLPNFAKGQTTQTIYPIKDAFVGTLYPDDNTGSEAWLWVSSAEYAPFEICHAYIYFDLPSDYNSYSAINLHFYIVLSDNEATFDIIIYRINQDWNELALTWTNRPSLGDYLLNWPLESHRTHDINVKDYISSNVFSICIIAEDFQYNLGQIPSKESESFTGDNMLALVLINTITDLDPIIISSIVGLVAISGAVVIIFFLYKRRKANFRILSDSKESIVDD